jgi:hypothetical protein
MTTKRNPKKIIIEEDDDIDEKSLRERMNAAEDERQKRQKERQQRKKQRRERVEKMVYQDRPVPLSQDEKLDLHNKKILEELERREKILEEKMKRMETKMESFNEEKNKELEDKLINNFIKKIALENYNKLDNKLKILATSLNTQIEEISSKNKDNDIDETLKMKSMFNNMQTKLKDMENELNSKKDMMEEDDIQYEQMQRQINDITLLLARKDTLNKDNEIILTDLEKKIGKLVNENVDELYSKLDKKIDKKLTQENRINEIMERILKIEDISEKFQEKPTQDNIDEIMESAIEQLKHNSDIRMEKMYVELRKRINKLENVDDDNVNIKESMIKDMERRLYEMEVYKKRKDQDERKKLRRLEKQRKKDEKRSFMKKKNRILQKHNLITNNDEPIIEEVKEVIAVKEEEKELKKPEIHPYMELLNKLKLKLPRKTLSVYNQKEIDNLYKELGTKNQKYRNKVRKVMILKKNQLKNKYGAKKAFGVSRGTIILDDKELERVSIYKKYGCEIKERFMKRAKIYLKYMHNFTLSLLNKETQEKLCIYYDESVKPKMVIIEYKNKSGIKLEKCRRTLKIGEDLIFDFHSFEDNIGEHLNINFDKFNLKFNRMMRVTSLESNCHFEIVVEEFDDDELFDI